MTKWFNTHHHNLIPKLSADLLASKSDDLLHQFNEVQMITNNGKAVLLVLMAYLYLIANGIAIIQNDELAIGERMPVR